MTNIQKLFPRVALVADQMTALGGADKEMFSILKLFPDADIFTIYFNKSKYPDLKNKVYTSFVQKLLPPSFSRHLKVFSPWVYENFNLEGYDLVISISAGPARGIITGIYQPHVAMVMTPPRNLWDKEMNIRGSKLKWLYKPISLMINTHLRMWDWSISKRVDYWTANSQYIANKIMNIYQQKASVIYPGVESKYFEPTSEEYLSEIRTKFNLPSNFVLVVSRLYDYKRIDWAIRACKESNRNLVIVGEGPDMKYLKKVAGKDERIKFLNFIKEEEKVALYKLAQGLLFCGVEDFGIVPVEAMASGLPVLGLREGGVLETIKENISGKFFSNEKELVSLLKEFDKRTYNKEEVVKHARNFTEEKFINNLEKYLTQIYEEKSKTKSRRT